MALRSVNQLDSATVLSIPVDVRGWEVRTSLDDDKVGKVHDVLVDEAGTARYLDVDLGIFQKHVLLPVGQAVTDEARDVVWVDGMNSDSFEHIPEYKHGEDIVDAEFERRLTSGYDERLSARRYHRAEYGGAGVPMRATGSDPTLLGTADVRLRRLSELDDYEVADHDPDPRGWELVSATGEAIGEVDDLIVDPQALKARYLEVELKRDVTRDKDDGHALIPVGYARLDPENHRVRVDALAAADVAALPRFHDEFDDDYEDRVERHFATRFEGSSRYGHPRYDAARLYSARAPDDTVRDRLGDVRRRR
jgi:photosynthetic reaction center H subunit